MQHVIRKQLFEISSARRDELFSLQHEASNYYYKQVLPLLEKIFDELSNDDEVLQLDRLEIDLGLIAWDKDARKIDCKDLEKLLRKKISDDAGSKVATEQDRNEEHVPGVKRIGPAQNACEQWIYYMQHGVLPWNLPVVTGEWKMLALEILATEFSMVTLLRNMIRQKESIARRIVLSHDESFLVQLAGILTAREQKALPQLVNELVRFYRLIESDAKQQQPAAVWIRLLQNASGDGSKNGPQQLIQELMADHFTSKPISEDQFSVLKKELILLDPLIENVVKDRTGEETTKSGKRKDNPGITSDNTINDKAAEDTITKLNKDKATEASKEIIEEAFASPDTQLPDEGIFVEYAGLLLLHPFLRSLFKNTNLLKEGKFIDRHAQEKAILLLHYAVTGNTRYEEYQLVVPKILCSWPLEEPLSVDAALTPHEITEAEDMLNAAIAQWSILKNTSPEGLREGFLQRRGKTFMHNGSIYFQLEKNAIDVLLDHLPWNLSIIKLPWLNELIRVEWR